MSPIYIHGGLRKALAHKTSVSQPCPVNFFLFELSSGNMLIPVDLLPIVNLVVFVLILR